MQRRFEIPKELLGEFQQYPRFVIDASGVGIWPLGPELLKNPEFVSKLTSKGVLKNFEIVLMPRIGTQVTARG